MPENDVINAPLLSEPVGSPLIDSDEPATAKEPAPAAEDNKADTPASEAEEPNSETPEQQEAKKQSRRQRQRERHIKELAAAQTEARLLREQLAKGQQTPAAPQADAEPKRDDYADYESYIEARADWRADKKVEEKLKGFAEVAQASGKQAVTRAAEQKQAEDWTRRETEYIGKTPDYVETVTPFVEDELQQFSYDTRKAIVELGPEVLHHLATHPDEVDDLLKLSPIRQIAALGRIGTEAKEPPKPRAPEPPAPAKHLRQGNTAATTLSDDMDTYLQQRAKQGARWAR